MRLVSVLHGWRLAIAAIVFAGFTAIIVYMVYQLFFADNPKDLPASVTGGGRTNTNLVLDTNPYAAVRRVYQRVAENMPTEVCSRFTDEAARQFAADFGASNCPEAVVQLSTQVDTAPGGRNAYAEPDFHGKMQEFDNQVSTIDISSCDMGITAGPRLGRFTLNRISMGQWIIAGHHNETC